MRIVLVTQDEELYLYNALKYWFALLSEQDKVVACVLLNPAASGAGRKVSFFSRAANALSTFGFRFFINVSVRFIFRRLLSKRYVGSLLRGYDVPVLRLEKSINHSESISLIGSFMPDVIVSIQGNEIFKRPFLDIAPCLNLHTAPLPLYRGLMPTFWALHNEERVTAVSVFLVDEGIDSGDIYVQYPVPINGASLDTLIARTKEMGMVALHDAIECVRRGESPQIPNSDKESTYYGFPTRTDTTNFRRRGARFF